MQLALDSDTNDIILGDKGVSRVDQGRYTVQAVKTALQTTFGEYALNPTEGWLNFDDFIKNPDLFDIELRAREIILRTKGVLAVEDITMELKDRVLTITIEATSVYGAINLTVPWSGVE